jgi:hypothetical protein
VGVSIALVGGLLLYANSKVQEIIIDYSNCAREASDVYTRMPLNRVQHHFKKYKAGTVPPQWKRALNTSVTYADSQVTVPNTNKCFVVFSIEHDLKPPVLLYYQLTNFYQNHRRYLVSFDANQLAGQPRTTAQICMSDCGKLEVDEDLKPADCSKLKNRKEVKPYYPCGLIANSIFNDTFMTPHLLNQDGSSSTPYNMSRKGIAWKNNKDIYKKTSYDLGEVVPPPNWARRWDYTKKLPDLASYEELHNWMRTAALPKFSNLAMRNDHTIMKRGVYELEIWDGMKQSLITSHYTS